MRIPLTTIGSNRHMETFPRACTFVAVQGTWKCCGEVNNPRSNNSCSSIKKAEKERIFSLPVLKYGLEFFRCNRLQTKVNIRGEFALESSALLVGHTLVFCCSARSYGASEVLQPGTIGRL